MPLLVVKLEPFKAYPLQAFFELQASQLIPFSPTRAAPPALMRIAVSGAGRFVAVLVGVCVAVSVALGVAVSVAPGVSSVSLVAVADAVLVAVGVAV